LVEESEEKDSAILWKSHPRIFTQLGIRGTPGVTRPSDRVVQQGEVRSRDVAVVLNIVVELWALENVEERLHEALLRDGVVWSTERNDPAEPTGAR